MLLTQTSLQSISEGESTEERPDNYWYMPSKMKAAPKSGEAPPDRKLPQHGAYPVCVDVD